MGAAKWGVVLAISATAAACTIYGDDLLEPTGSGGGGAGQGGGTTTGGAGGGPTTGGGGQSDGGGGSGMDCTGPTECPGADTDCSTRTCTMGDCGTANTASGTDCDDMGGHYCNGQGSCVECVAEAHCAPNENCVGNQCMTDHCASTSMDANETDVDCGGPDCPPCAFGQMCLVAADCTSNDCDNGSCAPLCGDGLPQGGEPCDDANPDPFDGCLPGCIAETDHLLISEVKRSATTDEFIEIYNPTNGTVDLSTYYLADNNSYYLITTGGGNPVASDFRVHFPNGTQIAAHAFVVVSLETATDFNAAFGAFPDFDFSAADANAPDMVGQFGATSGLTDASEMVVLFQWDGVAAVVKDVDYMSYGNDATVRVDKTGIPGYAADTPAAAQMPAGGSTYSIHRCDTAESTETKNGGNGITGDDETSENATSAFKATSMMALPSPGAPPPSGFCP